MPWLILSILPNIDLRVEIAAEQVAIVPPTDERVVALRGEHPNLEQFLARFRGSHGRAVHPAILLSDAQAPDTKRTGEAMVGIRNALAVSTVLQQTALELLYPQGHRILFTDPFDFYPWNLDRNFDRMLSITPASMAIHRVDDFAGQPSPGSDHPAEGPCCQTPSLTLQGDNQRMPKQEAPVVKALFVWLMEGRKGRRG